MASSSASERRLMHETTSKLRAGTAASIFIAAARRCLMDIGFTETDYFFLSLKSTSALAVP